MKRSYRRASVSEQVGGYGVALDDRPVRTPAKRVLLVPTRPLADALAGEWNAQGEAVEPLEMPLTRLANSAVDGVALRRVQVIEEIVRHGATDLVCYRADGPPELVALQSAEWQPLVEWLAAEYDIGLEVVSGVLPVAQSEAALASFNVEVAAFDDFPLTGLHAATAACGSLVIALALARAYLNAEAAWALSQLDETYQIERWGEDAEAAARRDRLRADIEAASRFMVLSEAPG